VRPAPRLEAITPDTPERNRTLWTPVSNFDLTG
jgi:hypothetical protein